MSDVQGWKSAWERLLDHEEERLKRQAALLRRWLTARGDDPDVGGQAFRAAYERLEERFRRLGVEIEEDRE